MVLPVTRFLSSDSPTKPRRPAYNSVPYIGYGSNAIGSYAQNYARMWREFRQSPELYGVVSVPITDIIGDRPNFMGTDGRPLGRNKEIQARKIWRDNRMKETLRAILFDMFVTGDGYGWKGKLSAKQRQDVAKEIANAFSPALRTKEGFNKLFLKASQDEALKLPKKFDYIASSTVQVIANEYDIIRYEQMSAGVQQKFTPEEVIHFRYENMDGHVQGYSPLEGLFREVSLLFFVKGNMTAYMENGGQPDKLYVLKNAKPGTPGYEKFQEALKSFKSVRGRHGSLLASGDVDIKDISAHMKDLQFKELALWCASNIALAYHIPVSRIPYLVGSSATNGDSGGLSDAGYWNMISERQDQIEDLMNSQFFNEFGYHLVLPRKYKQDEVREAQTMSMNSDTVQKIQAIYRQQGMKIKVDKINEMLKISPSDVEEMSEEERMTPQQRTGLMNQNLLDDLSIEKEPDNRQRADTKREAANSDSGVESRM